MVPVWGIDMNVASLELCKELYEVSGWRPSGIGSLWYTPHIGRDGIAQLGASSKSIPAYALGYLLRKLQFHSPLERNGMNGQWFIRGNTAHPKPSDYFWADTPEDAACKLAIELFKQGVLK